jgi:hypothetical protein
MYIGGGRANEGRVFSTNKISGGRKLKKQMIHFRFDVEHKDSGCKALLFYVSRNKLNPKLAYQICEKTFGHDKDWQKWTVKLLDTDSFLVGRLKDMDDWEWKMKIFLKES